MNGKQKCAALKEIRRDIAKANDIELDIPECTHKGDCAGTCPRCESEVRYLERRLDERKRNGFKVVIAGISAGFIATGAVACAPAAQNADTDAADTTSAPKTEVDGDTHIPIIGDLASFELTGSMAYIPEAADTDSDESEDTDAPAVAGFIQAYPEEYDETLPAEEYRLEGDIAFPLEDTELSEAEK